MKKGQIFFFISCRAMTMARTFPAPFDFRTLAHSKRVDPVVAISSTRRTDFPATEEVNEAKGVEVKAFERFFCLSL